MDAEERHWQERRHWLSCERNTDDCPRCTAYTKTHYFNHNYLTTEGRTITSMNYSRSIRTPSPAPKALGRPFLPATSACPYEDDRVTLILFQGASAYAHEGRFITDRDEKRDALLNFRPAADTILVAWPGKDAQHIFILRSADQRTKALARFGLKAKTAEVKTHTAADGTVFIESD